MNAGIRGSVGRRVGVRRRIGRAGAEEWRHPADVFPGQLRPAPSIHEEATTSTVVPFMGLYNNLVIFDQQKPQNSLDTIRPDTCRELSR